MDRPKVDSHVEELIVRQGKQLSLQFDCRQPRGAELSQKQGEC